MAPADSNPTSVLGLAPRVWRGWNAHSGALLGAGLAFFGALAASPLVVVASAASRELGGKSVSPREVYDPIAAVVGPNAAGAVAQTVAHSPAAGGGSLPFQAIALAFSLLACAGLFLQFRTVLDIVFATPRPVKVRGYAGDLGYGAVATAVIAAVAVGHGLALRAAGTLPASARASAGVSVLAQAPRAMYSVTVDGKAEECAGLAALVANSASTGVPGMKIAPDVSVCDGLLDIAAAAAQGQDSPLLSRWRGKEIQLQATPAQAVLSDGEDAGRTPVEVSVVPGALSVVVPKPGAVVPPPAPPA